MNEHLAQVTEQLRGFNADLTEIADRIDALAARTYTRDERQALISKICGNADDDLITALALLTQHLCIVPAEQVMDETHRKNAERLGQDAALWLTDWNLRRPASQAAALIDPDQHTSGAIHTD